MADCCLDDTQHALEVVYLSVHGGDIVRAAFDGVEVSGDAVADPNAQRNEAGGQTSQRREGQTSRRDFDATMVEVGWSRIAWVKRSRNIIERAREAGRSHQQGCVYRTYMHAGARMPEKPKA